MLANRFRSSLKKAKSREYTIKNKKYIVWKKMILETALK